MKELANIGNCVALFDASSKNITFYPVEALSLTSYPTGTVTLLPKSKTNHQIDNRVVLIASLFVVFIVFCCCLPLLVYYYFSQRTRPPSPYSEWTAYEGEKIKQVEKLRKKQIQHRASSVDTTLKSNLRSPKGKVPQSPEIPSFPEVPTTPTVSATNSLQPSVEESPVSPTRQSLSFSPTRFSLSRQSTTATMRQSASTSTNRQSEVVEPQQQHNSIFNYDDQYEDVL